MRILLIVALAALVAGAGFGLQKSAALQITSVSCQTDQAQPCPEPITAELQQLLDSSIIFVDHAAAVERVLAEHPARLENVQKTMSGELLITITIDKPLYTVQLNSGETYWMSQGGKSSQQLANPPSELPSVMVHSAKLDEVLDNHTTLVSLLQYADQLELQVESLIWHAHYQVEVRFHSIPVPVLIDMSSWQLHLTRAKAVISLNQLESASSTQYLDARFELPVLREQLEQERVSQ